MKFQLASAYLLFNGQVHVSNAFINPSSTNLAFKSLRTPSSVTFTKAASSSSSSLFASSNNNEFDYLLGEGTRTSATNNAQIQSDSTSKEQNQLNNVKNMIRLPDSTSAATATLTSSVTYEDVAGSAEESQTDDIFGDSTMEASTASPSSPDQSSSSQPITDPRLAELIRTNEKRVAMKTQSTTTTKPPLKSQLSNFLKGKDFGEIFFFVLVPLIGGSYLTKEVYNKLSSRVVTQQAETLEDYANEMIYHDGDFDEMKLAHADYAKKLAFMGPKKGDAMIKKYLEFYAKKKTVSPQAISSLSYVFSMYKLTEDRAAQVLCELCSSMPEKIASAGKLLFFGTHILKSKEAQSKLQPIKDLLASSYRDDGVISGEEIVDRSQLAMGEAAYRAAVAAAGKDQTDLTIGWEVLGLTKETATEIFEEVAKEGFMSGREAKYGRAYKQKYDDKGRKIDDKGELKNPEEADNDDEDDGGVPSGNVQECTQCGYTLFVAEGRDFKFFGADFKCPECGAPKDKFKSVDTTES